jgi:isocitrate/isopropylmalate dehydrogenase
MSPSIITSHDGTAGTAISGRPSYKIASIPADGIGPEVIEAGIQVLKRLAEELDTLDLKFTHFYWSSDYYKKHGKYLPDHALDIVREYDSILFGAVGAPGLFIHPPNFSNFPSGHDWLL